MPGWADNHSWQFLLSVVKARSRMTLLQSKTDCYHVIGELGRGTFGKVLKAQKKETGQLVAIKVIKNDLLRSRVIKNEIKLLKIIQQVNTDASPLIRFFEHFNVQDKFCLVFELLQQNLYEYQKENRFAPIPVRHIRTITTQVLEALSKLKELSIIHSDLKPENIVLVDQVRYPFRVKVIDFGSASILSEVKHVTEPYIQSRFYRAPEILLGLPFCEKLDMWSLGCVIVELHFGYPLYPGNNEYDQIRYICETQGLPDNYLLNAASKAFYFFKNMVDTQRRTQWRIKTEEEYQLATKGKPVERRKFVLKSLDQIELLYTPQSCYPEVLAEYCDLRNMVDLMKMMLMWDSNKRIHTNAAIKHPFISLQNLKLHHKNTKYYQLSKQCQYDATQYAQTLNNSMPPERRYGLWSPNYYHGPIMNNFTDGYEVEKVIEQMNDLHIEKSTEEVKVTHEATSHQEPAGHEDLPHLRDSTCHTKSRRKMVTTRLDNYQTSKTSMSPQFSKSDRCFSNLLFIRKQTPDPAIKHGHKEIAIINTVSLYPGKFNVEDHTALKKLETKTKKNSTAPPMGRVRDCKDKWMTDIEEQGDQDVRVAASHIMAYFTDSTSDLTQTR
ncbi:homeodomain-interacting protein kinase 4 [Rhinoderma darwinii]|uniref:homeodomain-interacting protein kinase 4 n=1 Tax=Rhinoderma darwinii TaxID=43563 RepID=UPI003F680766